MKTTAPAATPAAPRGGAAGAPVLKPDRSHWQHALSRATAEPAGDGRQAPAAKEPTRRAGKETKHGRAAGAVAAGAPAPIHAAAPHPLPRTGKASAPVGDQRAQPTTGAPRPPAAAAPAGSPGPDHPGAGTGRGRGQAAHATAGSPAGERPAVGPAAAEPAGPGPVARPVAASGGDPSRAQATAGPVTGGASAGRPIATAEPDNPGPRSGAGSLQVARAGAGARRADARERMTPGRAARSRSSASGPPGRDAATGPGPLALAGGPPAATATSPSQSATPAGGTPVTVDASSRASLAQGLSGHISTMHQAGSDHAVLNLNPPGLGQVQVHLRLEAAHAVHVTFTADNRQVGQAINQTLPGLGDALNHSGLHLVGAEVAAGGGGPQHGGHSGHPWPGTARGALPPPADSGDQDPAEAGSRAATGVNAYA